MQSDFGSVQKRIDPVLDEFESAWKSGGDVPLVAEFLARVAEEDRKTLVVELVLLDRHYRQKYNRELSEDDYVRQLPDFAHEVSKALDKSKSNVDDTLCLHDATQGKSRKDTTGLSRGDLVKYFGDYEIIDEIARGGMGVVYRAKQLSLNRVVALKMILAGNLAGESDVRRFQMEAEAAANLDHPGIVPIYDIGVHQGQHYFSMKLIEGDTLSQIEPALSDDPIAAVELVAKVADAVHHAHQRGIMHRDLKPANILLNQSGDPMITDFGLARDMQSDSGLTQTGAIVGTPGFMSPEQAAGKTATTAADIYSLGAILYQLLCGRPPHQAETVMNTLLSVMNEEPPNPSNLNTDIDSDLELVLQKCLAKDPSQRYSSAAELAADLRANLAGEPVTVRAPSAFEVARLWIRKNYGNAIWIPIIAIVVGVTTGAALWVATFGQDLSASLKTYEHFPSMDRPLLAQKWDTLTPVVIPVIFIMMGMIGWATAKLVRTKNRAADIGAGLSVGLLAGLLAFGSGMGATMLDTMRTATWEDGELLIQLAVVSDKTYAHERILTRYPTLADLSESDRAFMVKKKRQNDHWAISVIGISLGTVICLVLWGISGLAQTWIAGPLVREKSTLRGLFSYACFTIPMGALMFGIGGEVSMFLLLGSSAVFEWAVPVLIVMAAMFSMCAVVKDWHWGIQLVGVIATCSVFFYGTYLGASTVAPPLVAQYRTELKKAKQLVEENEGRREYSLRLTRAHHTYATLLNNTCRRPKLALDEYARAIDAIEAGKNPAKFEFEDRVLHSQLLYEGGALAQSQSDFQRGAAWLAQHSGLYHSSAQSLKIFGQLAVEVDDAAQFIRQADATDVNSWRRLAGQLRAIATAKDDASETGKLISDAWVDGVAVQRLNSAENADGAADWDRRKAELHRWLTARQTWELFGPHDVEPTAYPEDRLKTPYGPEADLISGKDVKSMKTVHAYAGATVDLNDHVGDKTHVVCYAKTTFTLSDPVRFNLRFGSDDCLKVWLDGEMLLNHPKNRSTYEGSDVITLNAPLSVGPHTLLLKVVQAELDWSFVVDASDLDGWPLAVWAESKEVAFEE